MLHIGLTGGIAAGKSTVAGVLADLGAEVIDADALSREAVAPGTAGLRAVVEAFGEQVLTADGALDRPALGRIVFGDDGARARLEAIVHPEVRRRSDALVAGLSADAVVVHDVPLIVENAMAARFHLVVVAGASEQTRVQRLVDQRGMDPESAWARIRAQADDRARREVADVWIDTEQDLGRVHEVIRDLWHQRLVPFAQNLAAGRPAPRPDGPARLVAPPPGPRTWPEQAEQLLARIRYHGAGSVRTADHVGSTSVPGLPAKDVLDLQVGVADLDDAGGALDALRQAGFAVVPGRWSDTPKPGQHEADRWAKFLLANTDPVRPVNLHVREVGSPGWRYALGFRDWLRADPGALTDYRQVKEDAARRHQTTSAYAQAKEPWFTEAWPRLQQWIQATGWVPPA